MNAILHRITESNLSDFKGLAVEGEIPVSEEILNDIDSDGDGKNEIVAGTSRKTVSTFIRVNPLILEKF